MPRPFTRAQVRQNRLFLAALVETGNARLAARRLGVNRSTYLKRRSRCPAFAALWACALNAAHLRFAREGGPLPPEALRPDGEGNEGGRGAAALRTAGGELTIILTSAGRYQLREALPGRITDDAEWVFLAELARTNNVCHAAAAAGFAPSSVGGQWSNSGWAVSMSNGVRQFSGADESLVGRAEGRGRG